jgi:hypothetical protein
MSGADDVLPVVPGAQLEDLDPQKNWFVRFLWTWAGVGFIGGHPKMALSVAVEKRSSTPGGLARSTISTSRQAASSWRTSDGGRPHQATAEG